MRPFFLIVSLLVSACGASGSRPADGPGTQAGAGSGSDVVCHEERQTGSSIPHEVCRSKMQSDADRKGAEDFLNTPRPSPPPPGGH
ncbi:MAG: hypothetical protein ABIY55_19700 [Kofleriaceae bacterium]